MKKNKLFVILVISLSLIEISSIFLMCKSLSGRVTKLDNVDLKQSDKNNNLFAIMLGDGNGSYTKYDGNSWPNDGTYSYNSTKSGCLDSNGNIINGALSFNENTYTAVVNTGSTSYCYIYLDKLPTISELCTSGDVLGNCLTSNNQNIASLNDELEGGLYRYQGINVNNYICFGTNDKDTCIGNTDAYMYRIMGVDSSNQIKLIKKEALNETMYWYTDQTIDITWPNSLIYSSINESAFLTNATYVPSGWSDKIAESSWKYGDNIIFDTTASNLYSIENAWTDTISAKIGLMYTHDYYYGIKGGNNCSSSGDYETCKTSWLHLWQNGNDIGAPNANYEWTMSRYGKYSDGHYSAFRMNSNGSVSSSPIINERSVRPVFYLNADETYISGTGTLDDPIIISEPSKAAEYLMSNPTTGLNTTKQGGLYRYQGTTANNYICFGTSDKATCTGNTDAYMYRIMGINSSNQLKLIKKEALNSTIQWYTDYTTNITWPNSIIYSSINGSTFLTNTTYVPSGWSDKIATTTWKYGDNTTNNTTAANLYSIESAWTSTTSAKIGLMYMHDYYYGIKGGNNCSSSGAYSTCKTSWLYISKSDTGAPTTREWTMSRWGYDVNCYAWIVGSDGSVGNSWLTTTASVRPVFYLASDVRIVGGSGTLEDPFIIN